MSHQPYPPIAFREGLRDLIRLLKGAGKEVAGEGEIRPLLREQGVVIVPVDDDGPCRGLRQSAGQGRGIESRLAGGIDNAFLKVHIADNDRLSLVTAAGGCKDIEGAAINRDRNRPKSTRECLLKHLDGGQGIADGRIGRLRRGQGHDFRAEIRGVDGSGNEVQVLLERAGEGRIVRHDGDFPVLGGRGGIGKDDICLRVRQRVPGDVHQLLVGGRVKQLIADEAGPGVFLLYHVDGPGSDFELNRKGLAHGVVVGGEFALIGVAGGQIRHGRRHDEGIVPGGVGLKPLVVVEHILHIHNVGGVDALGQRRVLPLDNGDLIEFALNEMRRRLEGEPSLETVADKLHGIQPGRNGTAGNDNFLHDILLIIKFSKGCMGYGMQPAGIPFWGGSGV